MKSLGLRWTGLGGRLSVLSERGQAKQRPSRCVLQCQVQLLESTWFKAELSQLSSYLHVSMEAPGLTPSGASTPHTSLAMPGPPLTTWII